MSEASPSLLYLTIYNPTLRPDTSATLDDEDAEEQAQILFYTSRDRAVSRDKMLRQVGLAKALINFAEIFHSTDSSQSVHSQTRRMITVSPEPNFWMHVTIELAKTSRAPTPKTKAKDKGKGKEKEVQDQLPQLEYHDSSLHDSAVRAHLLRGYEQFKLTHGSFISILSSLGQQALELQLERFFTVWAWSWDLDKGFSLSVDLGLPLHPSYQLILPLIDDFSSRIPEGMATLVLTQSYVAPSSKYRSSQYPVSLARHLMKSATPERGTITMPPLPSTSMPEQQGATSNAVDEQRLTPELPPSGSFLGVSISMNMGVRKWSWPSFGKSPSPKEPEPVPRAAEDSAQPLPLGDSEAQVDHSALEDAITSDNSFSFPVEKQPALDEREKRPEQANLHTADANTPRPSRVPSPIPDSSEVASNFSLPRIRVRLDFATKDVFLAPSHEPAATARRKVYLLKRADHAVALLGGDAHGDVAELVDPTMSLLEDIEKLISEDAQRDVTGSLPSVSKILQPKDGHIIRTGNYVKASMESSLNSDYLFEAKRLLDGDSTVVEVFSRGLHPQHWHVVARSSDPSEDGKGEAYLEVSRKEATLSDADNVMRGLYKTHV